MKMVLFCLASMFIVGCQTVNSNNKKVISEFNSLVLTKYNTTYYSAGWNTGTWFYIKNRGSVDIKEAEFIVFFWDKDGLPVSINVGLGESYYMVGSFKNLKANSTQSISCQYDSFPSYMICSRYANNPYMKFEFLRMEDFNGNVIVNTNCIETLEKYKTGYKLNEDEKKENYAPPSFGFLN